MFYDTVLYSHKGLAIARYAYEYSPGTTIYTLGHIGSSSECHMPLYIPLNIDLNYFVVLIFVLLFLLLRLILQYLV